MRLSINSELASASLWINPGQSGLAPPPFGHRLTSISFVTINLPVFSVTSRSSNSLSVRFDLSISIILKKNQFEIPQFVCTGFPVSFVVVFFLFLKCNKILALHVFTQGLNSGFAAVVNVCGIVGYVTASISSSIVVWNWTTHTTKSWNLFLLDFSGYMQQGFGQTEGDSQLFASGHLIRLRECLRLHWHTIRSTVIL